MKYQKELNEIVQAYFNGADLKELVEKEKIKVMLKELKERWQE